MLKTIKTEDSIYYKEENCPHCTTGTLSSDVTSEYSINGNPVGYTVPVSKCIYCGYWEFR